MADTRIVVNGRAVTVTAEADTPLVHVLRNDLGMFGVRTGCGIGECGSCTVLADQRAIRSCVTPLSAVTDTAITTPEGLGTPDAPSRVQRAFLDEQAGQCGYCVNGMISSAEALFAAEPAPDESAIQAALADHICRCGTQHRILRAMRGLAGQEQPLCASVIRPDEGPDHRVDGAASTDGELSGAELSGAERVEQWLRPLPDGRIEARSGRAELGQGVRTALAQVVAAELGIDAAQIAVRSAATDQSPDEGYTAGSASVERGGSALARAAAAFRRLAENGLPPTGQILPEDQPRWSGQPLGVPVARADLVPKLTGAPAYIHDLAPAGLVHARALLPPTYDARPVELDLDGTRAMTGVLDVVHDGGVVLVIAQREEQAVRAVARLARTARWDDPGLALDENGEVRPEPVVAEPGSADALAAHRQISASYAKPHEAHASMAPSCAVALAESEQLTVWTHSQGVYPLRRELAELLGESVDRLRVRHVDGPGCYGHNGADDAAGFAVFAARAVPGRPVRFVFSVADEFGWEPYGPAMAADLDAALDETGQIAAWRFHLLTGAHTSRPRGGGDRLAVAWLRDGGVERPWAGGGEGGVRNAVPLYDLPARDIRADYVRGPLRTSALRSLGAYLNVFAIESFMDELAEAADLDPVEFRTAQLSDERAREVLRLAAQTARWHPRVGPSGRGQGIAVARYKQAKAYVAQVAEVVVRTDTATIEVGQITTVCDAGVIVNPDGLRNQLEGGTLQGLSRALHEEVRYTADGIASRDWTSYPVLRFAEVPRLETVLLDRPGYPPLGAGEASTPVVGAAVANAVDDAIGVRLRRLPLGPERLRARLVELDEQELSRVLI